MKHKSTITGILAASLMLLFSACSDADNRLDAVKTGNVEEQQIDVNHADEYGNTALHHAVRDNQIKDVKQLLAHTNINVNMKNKKGETPLFVAGLV